MPRDERCPPDGMVCQGFTADGSAMCRLPDGHAGLCGSARTEPASLPKMSEDDMQTVLEEGGLGGRIPEVRAIEMAFRKGQESMLRRGEAKPIEKTSAWTDEERAEMSEQKRLDNVDAYEPGVVVKWPEQGRERAQDPIRHTVAGIWCVTIPAETYDGLRERVSQLEDQLAAHARAGCPQAVIESAESSSNPQEKP